MWGVKVECCVGSEGVVLWRDEGVVLCCVLCGGEGFVWGCCVVCCVLCVGSEGGVLCRE